MKKSIIAILACTALVVSACYDDSDIKDRVDSLEARVTDLEETAKTLNTNVGSLQSLVTALGSNDFVTDVTPVTQDGVTVGYTIKFSKSDPITIYNGKDGKDGVNGKDGAAGAQGAAPQISVKADTDGVYYWTINGDWLTVDGHKIQASVATPRVRVTSEGKWEISTDNGATWTEVEGANTSSVFSSVTQTDSAVTFTLTDGTTLTIPKYQELGIEISTQDVEVKAGATVTLTYTVTGGDDATVVDAIASDAWTVAVTATDSKTGTISITAPTNFTEGKIWIYVTDGKGRSVIKTLRISKKEPQNIDGTIEEVDA